MILTGIAQGVDYKFRDPGSKYWYYKPLETLMFAFVHSWLIFPAIWSLRKNDWGPETGSVNSPQFLLTGMRPTYIN